MKRMDFHPHLARLVAILRQPGPPPQPPAGTTDLDRLHRVIENPPYGERGAGRTFASCHHLAGILETCDEGAIILWRLPRMGWLDHIRPMLSRVLDEHGIPYTWKYRDMLVSGTKTVHFRDVGYFERGGKQPHHYEVETYGETEEYTETRHRPARRHGPDWSKFWAEQEAGRGGDK